jgi:hypothetical protein
MGGGNRDLHSDKERDEESVRVNFYLHPLKNTNEAPVEDALNTGTL